MSNKRRLPKPSKPRLPAAAARELISAAAVSAVAEGITEQTRYCQHLAGKEKKDIVLVLGEDSPGTVGMVCCKECAAAGGAVPVIHVDGRST